MCCSHLLMLDGLLTEHQIEQLSNYFASLTGSAVNNITVSKVSRAILVSPEKSAKVLTKCKETGLLKASYAIRCPECYTFIKRVDKLNDIPKDPVLCYSCDNEFEITSNDIEVLFSLVNPSVFSYGQQAINEEPSARPVAPIDTLQSIFLAGGINQYLFSPTEDEYQKLERMYDSIFKAAKSKKMVGDTLEDLTQYLFGLCACFKVGSVKTTTNQIDCCVRNTMYLDYGIFRIIGSRFYIECKNEKETPSGSYMSKLYSIIRNTNGKGLIIKFGIIVSKEKGPATFKKLANKIYLSDSIIMIAICGDELNRLIKNRENLLELIERKVDEVIFDSTNDLRAAGLYNS